ncbi:hypothetical protein [Veronia pacifica]|nr:hypothetical protein [Veronia pacifica]
MMSNVSHVAIPSWICVVGRTLDFSMVNKGVIKTSGQRLPAQ